MLEAGAAVPDIQVWAGRRLSLRESLRGRPGGLPPRTFTRCEEREQRSLSSSNRLVPCVLETAVAGVFCCPRQDVAARRAERIVGSQSLCHRQRRGRRRRQLRPTPCARHPSRRGLRLSVRCCRMPPHPQFRIRRRPERQRRRPGDPRKMRSAERPKLAMLTSASILTNPVLPGTPPAVRSSVQPVGTETSAGTSAIGKKSPPTRPKPRCTKAAMASRVMPSPGQYVGGAPGGTQVFPAVMPAPAIAEISSWNGFASGTSVNWWAAHASGTATTSAAARPTRANTARRPRWRRPRDDEGVDRGKESLLF